MKIFILSCTFWTAKIYFKFLLINSDIVQLPVSQSLWLAFCYLLLFLYGPRILCIHDGLLVWKIMDRRDNVFFLWRLFALSPRGSRRADQLYPILDYAALQLVCNHGKSQSTSSLLRLLCCRLVALPLETWDVESSWVWGFKDLWVGTWAQAPMTIWSDPGTPSKSAEPSTHSFAPTLDFLGQWSTCLPRTQT